MCNFNTIKMILNAELILTEGSILENLERNIDFQFDPQIYHAGAIYKEKEKLILEQLHRDYIDIGSRNNIPMIVQTDTWGAKKDRILKTKFKGKEVNKDCVKFIKSILEDYIRSANNLIIAGVVGCKNNAYNPLEALNEKEAKEYHNNQCKELVSAGVDLLLGATLPALEESLGMAKAMSSSKVPYIISFIINSNGNLLDETPLYQAIDKIDKISSPPIYYMINCVHPIRVKGLQANASLKSPEELEQLKSTDAEDPTSFAKKMVECYQKYNLKILGGCCGTSKKHIEAITKKVLQLKEQRI